MVDVNTINLGDTLVVVPFIPISLLHEENRCFLGKEVEVISIDLNSDYPVECRLMDEPRELSFRPEELLYPESVMEHELEDLDAGLLESFMFS